MDESHFDPDVVRFGILILWICRMEDSSSDETCILGVWVERVMIRTP